MTLVNPQPGQVGFAHTTGIMGKLIRIGEALRGRRGSEFNHVFIVGDTLIDGEYNAIQATLRGVTDTAKVSEVAPGGSIGILELPEGVSPAMVLEFAKAQVGQRYGFLTILAIACDIVTWNWVPAFMGSRKPSWICSALGAESLRFGGWLHEWINSNVVTPAMLYCALTEQETP